MTHSASGSARRVAFMFVGVVGIVLLAALTFTSNGATRMLAWPWWAAGRVLLALPLAVLLIDGLTARAPRTRMGPAIASLLVGLALVQLLAALASAHPRESLAAAFTSVAVCALVFALNRADARASSLALVLGAGGAIFAVISVASWIAGTVLPQLRQIDALNAAIGEAAFAFEPEAFRNDRPLGHSNYTAGVALLALPWVMALAWRARRAARWMWIGAAVLLAAALVSSASRGGLIGLAAAGGFAAWLRARVAAWSRGRIAIAAVALLVLFALCVVAIPRARRSVAELFSGQGASVGDEQRLGMLRVGAAMGAQRWWIGQGPGLVPRLYPRWRHTVDGGVDAALQLHSTPLQWWAETGLPGVALGAVLTLAALRRALAAMRRDETGRAASASPWFDAAAGISVAGYAGLALTDYQLDLPVIAAFIAANVAVLARGETTADDAAAADRGRLLWPALSACALAGFFVSTLPEWRARGMFAHAIEALEINGAADAAEARFNSAAALAPDNPQIAAGAAAAHLRLAYGEHEAASRAAHFQSARLWLERSLVIEPASDFAHFNLGWLLLERDPRSAAAHFRAALQLAPIRGGVYFGLGLARLEGGDIARARDAFALEMLNDPRFVTSPAWEVGPLRELHDGTIKRAVQIADELAARVPAADQRALRYTRDLLRWWLGDDSVRAQLAATAPVAARSFFADGSREGTAALARPLRPTTPGWQVLHAALERAGERRELLQRFIFIAQQKPATTDELDVLEALLNHLGADWRAWLQCAAGREPPFLRTYRRERPGYPVLAGNLDVPVPVDDYLVQENGLAQMFFGFVFPERGRLPDPVLVQYVAEHDL